jgi:hypothetical protein
MIYFESLLTPSECAFINSELEKALLAGSGNWDADDYISNCVGFYSFPSVDSLFSKISDAIAVKSPIGPQINSYSRIYYNGAYLLPHVDRPGLEWTLTVCTHADIDWPIHAQDHSDWLVRPVIVRPGDGLLVRGTRQVHWRSPLLCRPDQRVVQHFFHWSALPTVPPVAVR